MTTWRSFLQISFQTIFSTPIGINRTSGKCRRQTTVVFTIAHFVSLLLPLQLSISIINHATIIHVMYWLALALNWVSFIPLNTDIVASPLPFHNSLQGVYWIDLKTVCKVCAPVTMVGISDTGKYKVGGIEEANWYLLTNNVWYGGIIPMHSTQTTHKEHLNLWIE